MNAVLSAAAAEYALAAVPECADEGIVRPCPACARERERVGVAFDAGRAVALVERQAAFRSGVTATIKLARAFAPTCMRYGKAGVIVLVEELSKIESTRYSEYPRD